MKWCALREYKWNEYVTIPVESQCKQLRSSPKKRFSGLQRGIRTRGPCVRAAVLYQLSYEDPYTGGRPIYWAHHPVITGYGFESSWSPEKLFFGLLRNCLNCDSTAMVTYSFQFSYLVWKTIFFAYFSITLIDKSQMLRAVKKHETKKKIMRGLEVPKLY